MYWPNIQNLFGYCRLILKIFSRETTTWGSTKLVLNALKAIFSDSGIPETIFSDNGLCYKSQEFQDFCTKFDICHVTGASYNHQANSIVECAIQAIKHLMAKNQNDTWLALLILKSTPITGIDKSPAELLCNRSFRTNISLIQHASSLANQAKLGVIQPSIKLAVKH